MTKKTQNTNPKAFQKFGLTLTEHICSGQTSKVITRTITWHPKAKGVFMKSMQKARRFYNKCNYHLSPTLWHITWGTPLWSQWHLFQLLSLWPKIKRGDLNSHIPHLTGSYLLQPQRSLPVHSGSCVFKHNLKHEICFQRLATPLNLFLAFFT